MNPETDEILFDGENIQYEEFVYIMMNKPKGVVSATEDNLQLSFFHYCESILPFQESHKDQNE